MEPPSEVVKRELLTWPGVTTHDHRFGGLEFRVNGREMGHMHGDELADLPFPRDVGKKLIARGKASPHHFIPRSGWFSYYISEQGDDGAIELFRMQYEHMTSYGKRLLAYLQRKVLDVCLDAFGIEHALDGVDCFLCRRAGGGYGYLHLAGARVHVLEVRQLNN